MSQDIFKTDYWIGGRAREAWNIFWEKPLYDGEKLKRAVNDVVRDRLYMEERLERKHAKYDEVSMVDPQDKGCKGYSIANFHSHLNIR